MGKKRVSAKSDFSTTAFRVVQEATAHVVVPQHLQPVGGCPSEDKVELPKGQDAVPKAPSKD